MLLTNTAYTQEAPLSFEYKDEFRNGQMWHFFEVQALVSSVTISSLAANQGNCKLLLLTPMGKAMLPMTMKYGETRIVFTYAQCKPLKVEASTDQGDWSFGFDP